MPSAFIELHDSDVESVRIENRVEATILMHLIIHKSEGIAGRDPGTEWMQHAELKIKNISALSTPPDEKKWIIDGVLVLGEKTFPNLLPIELDHSGYFYLSLIFDDGASFSISGNGLSLNLIGDPSFLQEYK
jgi:hypothetical protein